MRGTTLGAGRAIGVVPARGCDCGGGIRGLGRTTGAASSGVDESSLVDSCNLLQPLPMATITKMISQITPSMFASFMMLA